MSVPQLQPDLGVVPMPVPSPAVVSAAISPHLWAEWIHLLIHGGSVATPAFTGGLNIPLRLRLPVAVGLAVYGARKDRVGFLAAAVAIGSPVFNAGLTLSTFSVFAALPRLHGRRPKTVAATQPRPLLRSSAFPPSHRTSSRSAPHCP